MGKPFRSDVFVELHGPNFEAVKDFYSKLGFKIVWEEPAHGQKGYLVMKKGKSLMGFYCGSNQVFEHHYFKQFSKTTPRGYAVEITIPIRNIEDYYQKICQKIESKYIVEPLKISPWDKTPKKAFRLVDPFGFYLHFSKPMNMLYKE